MLERGQDSESAEDARDRLPLLKRARNLRQGTPASGQPAPSAHESDSAVEQMGEVSSSASEVEEEGSQSSQQGDSTDAAGSQDAGTGMQTNSDGDMRHTTGPIPGKHSTQTGVEQHSGISAKVGNSADAAVLALMPDSEDIWNNIVPDRCFAQSTLHGNIYLVWHNDLALLVVWMEMQPGILCNATYTR